MTARAAPPRKRFVLSGHSAILDPRLDAVRDDLADVELADRVFAPHYAKAIPYQVVTAAAVHFKPNAASEQIDILSIGATLDLFDLSAGWGWVRTAKGVGYIRADCVAPV
jgi:hypothetical protein